MNEEVVGSEEGPTLLFIEPQQPPADRPLIDDLTRKLAGAYRLSHPSGIEHFGVHSCSCSALSDNTDHWLPDGIRTNSLCVQYLAYHRNEVPEVDLEIVRRLSANGVEPAPEEFHGPEFRRFDRKPIDHLQTQLLGASGEVAIVAADDPAGIDPADGPVVLL